MTIPKATTAAARFMESLRAKDPHALGFLPISAYDAAIRRHRVLFEIENLQMVGFLLWARRKTTLRVHQIAVAQDSRRIAHATNLIHQLCRLDDNQCATQLILRCADDLESNHFWTALGFERINVVLGGKTRLPRINLYANPKYFAIHRALGMRTLRDVIGPLGRQRMINVYRLRLPRIFEKTCTHPYKLLRSAQALEG